MQGLEDKVGSLELDIVHKEHRAAAEEKIQEAKINEISKALVETRMQLEAAHVFIDQVLRETPSRPNAPSSRATSSVSSSRLALHSRRPYVCVIIDGDANHFHPALLKAGGRGGEAAAERLKQEVFKFIAERGNIPFSCVVKVQIFMNRAGFVETVSRHDQMPKCVIDCCLDRFFQSQPTWDLVDTGVLRESADTKIKGLIALLLNFMHANTKVTYSQLQFLRRRLRLLCNGHGRLL
jgi:hypothetical protein